MVNILATGVIGIRRNLHVDDRATHSVLYVFIFVMAHSDRDLGGTMVLERS